MTIATDRAAAEQTARRGPHPTRTTSGCYLIRLREDMPRQVASDYWAGPHAAIAGRLPHLLEYNQYHFSATDHGFWPATPTVGTMVQPAWAMDGMTEVRLASAAAALTVPLHMRGVFEDEQNVFEKVLGHPTAPGGGRWWTAGHDDTIGHRTVLVVRRRRGVTGRSFKTFVHDRLGAALHRAGALDLRSYTFLPFAAETHITPGVSHDNPPHRRYHGAVVFGTSARTDVDALIAAPPVAAAIADQHLTCTAIHAFSVTRTVPVVRI